MLRFPTKIMATMPKLNWRIVDRYLAGEATQAERVLVERWLVDSPAFRKLIAEFIRGQVTSADIFDAQADVKKKLDKTIASLGVVRGNVVITVRPGNVKRLSSWRRLLGSVVGFFFSKRG